MRQEAWRAYLEMALGVTEASGKKALKTAKRLVGRSGVSAEQLQGMADELVRASNANREAITNLVRIELERALSAVGLAKADEVETLTARVRELESQLQSGSAGGVPSTLQSPPAKKAVAKKAVAKKAVAKKAVAKKAVATKAAAPKSAAPKKAATKTAAPTKTAAKAPAKAAAKKAPSRTATPSAIGEEITAPAPGPAGPPEPPTASTTGAAAPAKAAPRKTTKRTPGSGEPLP
jgi:polyhydroxyalkanoate synthesis regulator phasin